MTSAEPWEQSVTWLTLENKRLKRRADDLERTLERAGITGDLDVPGEIGKLAEAVAALAGTGGRHPPAPNWAGIDEVTREAELASLAAWVDEILVPFFPGSAPASCWRNHPDVIWELSTVAALWRDAYEQPRSDLYRSADWLDRWLPGAAERVRDAQADCKRGTCAVTRRRDIAS